MQSTFGKGSGTLVVGKGQAGLALKLKVNGAENPRVHTYPELNFPFYPPKPILQWKLKNSIQDSGYFRRQ